MKDYYKILGLTRDASPDQIKQKFRELAFENHPDVSDNPNAGEIFIEIYEAYHILSQPDKKTFYDMLYDKYTGNTTAPVPDEESIINNIRDVSRSARESAQQKAKVKYSDFVKDLDCFFIAGLKADGAPYYYNMHKNIGISGGVGPMGSIRAGIINIPVPRSKRAHLFHRTGFLIKSIFFVLAIIVFKSDFLIQYSLAVKIIVSAMVIVTGGLITMATYHLSGVRSKFFFAGKYPLVAKYKAKGYKRGFHPMISTTPVGLFTWLFRLIF